MRLLPLDVINKAEGMTLLEVLAALVILELMAAGLVTLFAISGKWIAEAERNTRANDYAIAIMETVRAYAGELQTSTLPSMPVEDKNNSDEDFYFHLNTMQPEHEIKAPPGMNAAINIAPYDDSRLYTGFRPTLTNNLFQVDVTVSWEEAGHVHRLPMSTVVSSR